MKVKELIKELQKYDGEQEVQMEIALFENVFHSRSAFPNIHEDFWVGEAQMRDPDETPLIIIGGYACNDGRKE